MSTNDANMIPGDTDELMLADVAPPEMGRVHSLREALYAVCAWCLLLLMECVMKLGGFERFVGLVGAWPTIGSVSANDRERLTHETCTAINRARTLYFRHVRCLQNAGAVVCALRSRGLSAKLVFGVRKFPFFAHAWAEVDGEIVNDKPSLRTEYVVLVEC